MTIKTGTEIIIIIIIIINTLGRYIPEGFQEKLKENTNNIIIVPNFSSKSPNALNYSLPAQSPTRDGKRQLATW